MAYLLKRKRDFEGHDNRAKRPFVPSHAVVDVDVLQARTQPGRLSSYPHTQGVSRRVNHAMRYPVNCDPVDGVSPNVHAMQVYRTSCPRCLQGEPGHFQHILEK
ncbi:uncharacterized protein LOC127008317 isoform X1 [Eriocheir sinensis]|uniref:uncharacterized protein LOC127008317 isoform X1 n=1 Tax=Eriocheir sinensis TaxID=95602 RepID=UPI0021C76A4A|nr:uncharacterized protein LOC127008317 isoform X1 [Eriocheir sinensis]